MTYHDPRYVAIAHVTNTGDIEQVNLCDNEQLTTYLLLPACVLPAWLTDRVALMRFCLVGRYVTSVKGRKYSDHMIAIHLQDIEYKQLSDFRIKQ
jgi:hypothetical protein